MNEEEEILESVEEPKEGQTVDEYIDESEKDINESLESVDIKLDEETDKMIKEINWDIVEYEDPEQYIPVFSEEQWEKLSKLGSFSPITFVHSQLDLLRLRVSEINTEDFQSMTEEEKKKEIDDIISSRNNIIGIVQSSNKHYDEMMSKENIASLDGIILSNIIQAVVSKNIESESEITKNSVFPMLLEAINNITSKKNVISAGFHCQFLSSIERYMRYEAKFKRLENPSTFKEIMDNKYKVYFAIIGEVISLLVNDNVDGTNEIHKYLSEDKFVELGKTIKDLEVTFKERIKAVLDNNSDELSRRLYEPTKIYFDKVLKKVGKTDDENNLTVKHSIELQNVSLFNDYITSLPSISPIFFIFEKFVVLVGELFNESNGMGIDKVFTTQSMAQFFFMVSLLRKYVFDERIKTNSENFNKPLKEVYSDEEVFENLKVISNDKEYHKGFKDIMFRSDSAKDIIDNIVLFIEKSVNDIKNSLDKVEVNNNVDNIVNELTYGRIYKKIQPFVVIETDNTIQRKKRRKKKR